MSKIKERNVSLDLLRVLAMFMIVMLHCFGKSGALSITTPSIRVCAWTMEALCIGAVNIYVLISGYFLVDSVFSWKKVFKLWGCVLFYFILFLGIYSLIGGSISKKDLLFSIFPVLTKTNYWFITTYLFMYIVSPFLNVLINNLTKRQHFNLCFILFIIFSIISFILPYESLLDNTFGNGIIWFINLYFIAAYIKKYPKKYKGKLLLYFVFSICIVSFAFLVEYILKISGVYINSELLLSRFYAYNSIFVALAAICIFLYFLDKKVENKYLVRFISFLSPLTFGIYLIHDNIFVRRFLYQGAFKLINYQNNGIFLFILAAILIAIVIFMVCSIIEFIRLKLFKFISRTRIYSFFQKFFSKIISIFLKCVDYIYEFI